MNSSIDTFQRAELRVGTRVDVYTRYEPGRWTSGFNIAAVLPDGYLIRRVSDGAVFSETVRRDEVRVVRPVRQEGAIGAPSSANTAPGIGVEQ